MKIHFESTPKGENWFYDFFRGGEKFSADEKTMGPVVELTANGIEYHVSEDYVLEVARLMDEGARYNNSARQTAVSAMNNNPAIRPIPCPACGAYCPGLGVKCSTCGGAGTVRSLVMHAARRVVWGVKAAESK